MYRVYEHDVETGKYVFTLHYSFDTVKKAVGKHVDFKEVIVSSYYPKVKKDNTVRYGLYCGHTAHGREVYVERVTGRQGHYASKGVIFE